ncbi:hypothetical protein GCM10020219_047700 [Nonomuraea dietziae]
MPAAGKPTFDLPETEVELGIGIHGEPGRHPRAPRLRRDLAAVAMTTAVHGDLPRR